MNVDGEVSPLTLREVVERHGGEFWFERERASHRSFFRLLIPVAAAQEALEPSALLGRGQPARVLRLRPVPADRGAAGPRRPAARRNSPTRCSTPRPPAWSPRRATRSSRSAPCASSTGGCSSNEIFEQLVDPRRPLPRESVDDPRHQPTTSARPADDREVLPGFHAFCEDTVLVGHNAAFDMRFLQMKEAATGVRFASRCSTPCCSRRWSIPTRSPPARGYRRAPRRGRHRPPHRPGRRHRHRRDVPQDDSAARRAGHPHAARGARGGRAHLLRQGQILQ